MATSSSAQPKAAATPAPARLRLRLQARLQQTIDLFLVFFGSYFVYLLTLYPTVGTEDSGELIVSAATLDIAHPPGYPLHTLLGKLFTVLIPFGNIGWRVNLMSAFFGAATVTIIFLIIRRLTKKTAVAVSFSLLLAFSDIFWSQSIRTETYTLNAFLLGLMIWFLTLWDQNKNPRYLLLTALCFGLGVANQHQILLAAPALFLFVLIKNWRVILNPKIVAGSLLMLGLGLSVYAYLPIRTAAGPYDNPAYIKHEGLHTWDSFFAFVNRQIYGGTVHLGSEETEASAATRLPGWLQQAIDISSGIAVNNAKGFLPFFELVFRQFFYLSFILLPFGFIALFKKNRAPFFLVTLLLFFFSIIQLKFVGYGWNMIPFSEFSSRPFFIPAILLVTIIAACGMDKILSSKKLAQTVPLMLSGLLFLPLIPLTVNFANNNESHNYIAYDFNRHVLESLPQNAYLLSIGRDNHTFPLYYLRKIENFRPDVELEIYYSKVNPDESILKKKSEAHPDREIFIDLLPHHYDEIDLSSWNFVYRFDDDNQDNNQRLAAEGEKEYAIRGIRTKMDYPNSKLKAYYYLKMALLNSENNELMEAFFLKVKKEVGFIEQFELFMNDYRGGTFDSGMF
ncbi:MAG TPA: DUF2723 domain-containing protein [Candidatus Gracilibacteria bacterium]|nr:DUF2723 domain-containing protein [Candidatus Gracilibacteria bacterium]